MKLAFIVNFSVNVVCSSYANNLGVYSIPFETINLDPNCVGNIGVPAEPSQSKPSMVQGNIVTTKSDKQPAIPAQRKINPTLVENSEKSQDLSTTIIQTSSNQPMNLDMNAFLGKTQKTKNDIEIINEV